MTVLAKDAINALRLDLFRVLQGAVHHASPGTPVSTADATDTASALSLATAIRSALATHFASTCDPVTGVGCHRQSDALTQLPADVVATTANLAAFTAGLAAALEAHCKNSACHYSEDHDNFRTDVDFVPSETRVWRQLNKIKSALNAHMAAALNSLPADT